MDNDNTAAPAPSDNQNQDTPITGALGQSDNQNDASAIQNDDVAQTPAPKGKGQKSQAKSDDAKADDTTGDKAADIDYSVAVPENFADKIGKDDPVFAAMGEVLAELKPEANVAEGVKKFVEGLLGKLDALGLFEESKFDLAKAFEGFENGKARSEALGAKIQALAARNDISEEEAAELGSLALSPAGVTALEKLFGKGDWKDLPLPKAEALTKPEAEREWQAIFADPRWNKDYRWMQEQEPRMEILQNIINS